MPREVLGECGGKVGGSSKFLSGSEVGLGKGLGGCGCGCCRQGRRGRGFEKGLDEGVVGHTAGQVRVVELGQLEELLVAEQRALLRQRRPEARVVHRARTCRVAIAQRTRQRLPVAQQQFPQTHARLLERRAPLACRLHPLCNSHFRLLLARLDLHIYSYNS